jgi:hypothetical protein
MPRLHSSSSHQPRPTERRPLTLVDLPRMPRLSIQANHLFRRLRLELLPLISVVSVVNWRWLNQHPDLTSDSWLCDSFCSSRSRVRRYSTPISRADEVHRSWMGHWRRSLVCQPDLASAW